jgi:phosphohistidine phosphatase
MTRPHERIDSAGPSSDARRVKIYLVRHGDAVAPHAALSDGHRYLSALGRQTCRAVGRFLREHGVTFDVILTSPLTRAVQTAELVGEAVDHLGVIESHPGLLPGAQPAVVAGDILSRDGSVAVFSHEPTVSSLAAFLVGQPSFAPFLPAQVCYFESRRPVWKLRPDVLQLHDLHIP